MVVGGVGYASGVGGGGGYGGGGGGAGVGGRGAGYGCGGALWVKADEVHKSDMIVLLKARILPTFLCNTKNIINYYLNQLYCSLPCEN